MKTVRMALACGAGVLAMVTAVAALHGMTTRRATDQVESPGSSSAPTPRHHRVVVGSLQRIGRDGNPIPQACRPKPHCPLAVDPSKP